MTDKHELISRPTSGSGTSAVFVSSGTPVYKINWQDDLLSVRGPLSEAEWATIAAIMTEHRIGGLEADQLSDAGLEHISRLNHVIRLRASGSSALTDTGARYLTRMPQLLELRLGGGPSALTDSALECLPHLKALQRFHLPWSTGISDIGLRHLAYCDQVQDVNLMGTFSGNGAIQALAGKPHLRRLSTGKQVTDEGLGMLHQIPVFKEWHGGEIQLDLMDFQAKPNQLLIDGPFTDKGLASLAGLDGVFSLILFRHSSSFTSAGLAPLRHLANLAVLGCAGERCDNEAMRNIALMPRLRKLLAQDAIADDEGFEALSHSQGIELIWGRACVNFGSRGFAALAKIPTLQGLGISCKFVDDATLSLLPQFPSLRELMPMDVTDEGFRHVGCCKALSGLWCMYCPDTGDAATEHIAPLPLRTYYAGQTNITDHSLDMLGRMISLERLDFWHCAAITDSGVSRLTALPSLREVSFEGIPGVTPNVVRIFPSQVRVQYVSADL